MSMVIGTNVASLSAQRQVGMAVRDQAEAMERLSSGKRINSAKDDAAGLGISNSMTSQIRGLDQAVRNANDGISMIQTAEGALDQTTNILQRMRELSVQSANGTYNDSENRASLNTEFLQLQAEIDRIADNTEFNGSTLLNGDQKNGVEIQVGDQANQTVEFSIDAMNSKSLGMGSTSNDFVGAEMVLTAGSTYATAASDVSIGYNDVLINGQSVIASGGTEFLASADSLDSLVNAINTNINGVSAGLLATAEITLSGDGNISTTEEVTVTLTMADDTTQTYEIRDANTVEEIAEKLNTAGGGAFTASVENGKFIVSAEGVKTLAVADGGSALGASKTVAGALTLTSDNGDAITVERGTTGTYDDLAALGLREFSEAGTIEGNGMTAASTVWGVGDVSINGVTVDEGTTAGSLATKVAAINAITDQTGVKAETFVTAELDFSAAAAYSGVGLMINGVSADAASAGATLADIAENINDKSDLTGISATVSGQKIRLEGNASSLQIGGNTGTANLIENLTAVTLVATKGNTISASTSMTSVANTVYGGLKLSSENDSPISVNLGTAASIAEHGLIESNVVGDSSSGASIGTTTVDTAANATKAIDIIDNALNEVNSQRGELGAVNNRLEFTVDNLQSVSQQTSAARSRILDADFAAESAALSKAQVLQQAGTAMLAQANSAPQQVLSILR
ncbi:MAG: flagellin [Gammaproteobacteria bacterium]|jgi:flagellin|nr:flagellin [Candidatus Neomarinimicrobiota bacterium]MBT4330851.1 flagellin [Gammaproteobacteria bacterium]MBT4606391.1 flagellin [Thiotrichales bacterium]MBT5269435.1 flagellin [Candidatus Neomarinimicrobiota bacterium]MBT7080592.1 flagellin [Chloroflexota bacterium]